jgi:hypothetical protein
MRARVLIGLTALSITGSVALLGAGPAMAWNPTPTNCGLTPSKTYKVRVDQGSRCDFGIATWHAIFHNSPTPDPFGAAESVNFTVNVPYHHHDITMDCRSIARAHGEHDYACNDLNRGGTRVVKLDNQTLP